MSDAVSYMSEPATHGKVLLRTSLGDLDVELFSRECPAACRNFVQHCLDSYYDGCEFHRVIKGFMAQTGDPTNTGEGGLAAFGEPFADEFHSRLKFSRRGMVGMASSGDGSNENRSQFFITLGPCEWLHRKHTLFAKVTGDTTYNLVKFDELHIENVGGKEDPTAPRDRPLNPPRILGAEVLLNPFPELVRRVKEKEAEKKDTRPKRKAATKKNLALLSFGDEESAMDAAPLPSERGSKSSHDLAADERLSRTSVREEMERARTAKERSKQAQTEGVREALGASRSARSERSEQAAAGSDEDFMADEAEFDAHMRKKLLQKRGMLTADNKSDSKLAKTDSESKRGHGGDEDEKSKDDIAREYNRLKEEMGLGGTSSSTRSQSIRSSVQSTQNAEDSLLSPLEARRAKYKTRKQNAALTNREADTLAKLAAFKAHVSQAANSTPAPASSSFQTVPDVSDREIPPVPLREDDSDAEADHDRGDSWLGHRLRFERRPQDFQAESQRFARDFAVHDPRGEEGSAALPPELSARRRDRGGGGPRKGTVGTSGGNRGLAGLHVHKDGSEELEPRRLQTAAEREAEEANERVMARLMQQHAPAERKRSRSRSRSRDRERERDRERRRSRSRSRSRDRERERELERGDSHRDSRTRWGSPRR